MSQQRTVIITRKSNIGIKILSVSERQAALQRTNCILQDIQAFEPMKQTDASFVQSNDNSNITSKLKSLTKHAQNMYNEEKEMVTKHEIIIEDSVADLLKKSETDTNPIGVMNTNEEVFEDVIEAGGNMEIEKVEEVRDASKSEDNDTADTPTDIDELLIDKLIEELVTVVELEEKKADMESVQINTENEASVNIVSTSVRTDDEDIKTGVNKIVDIEDIKIEDIVTAEEDSKDETETRKHNESLESKLIETKVEEAEIEAISNKLLEHRQIVESEIVDSTLNKTTKLDKPDEVASLIVQENETESVIKLSNKIVTEEKIHSNHN